MPRFSSRFILATPVVLLCCALPARADTPARASDTLVRERPPAASPITDRFALRATYFRGTADTRVQLDPSTPGLAGTLLDAEDDLAFDEAIDQGRMELYFRFGKRLRLRADYFKLNRFGATVLDETIVFGDDTYLAGEYVESSLDYRSLSFTLLYSFLRRDSIELSAGIGINLLEAEAATEAVERNAREEESGVAPLPAVALDGSWRFARRWSLNAHGQYFSATYDDIDGTLSEFHVDVQYRWKPNFAIGLGYTALDVAVRADPLADHDFPEIFRLRSSGPEFFIRASF
jgi:hypothetical protein